MSTAFSEQTYSGQAYLDHRPRYPQGLFDIILAYHREVGDEEQTKCLPQHEFALDLGCGPGLATAQVIPHFKKVVGVDESQTMVDAARAYQPLADFIQSRADDLGSVASETVDLLTSATAAHWFPPDWWKEASRVVKPGGTVALWSYSGQLFIDSSKPNAEEFNKHINHFMASWVNVKVEHGLKLALEFYDNFPLPSPDLKFSSPKRIHWNRPGTDDNQSPFMTSTLTVKQLRHRLQTTSPIYRWQNANPTKVGTDEDPLENFLSEVKKSLGWTESSQFECYYPLVLLMFKKS